MTNAKKTAKTASIVDDDEEALVDKIAQDIVPSGTERPNVKASPAYASEGPNGAPSQGPDKELGMTAVVDNSAPTNDGGDVKMTNADGVEMEIAAADVKMHERMGWKQSKEEGV